MSSMIETGVSSNDVLLSAVHDQQARTSMNCRRYHMRPVVIAIIISLQEGKGKKTTLDAKLKEAEKDKNKKIEA